MRPARSFLLLKVVITVIIQLFLWLLFCVYEVSDFVTQAGKLTFFSQKCTKLTYMARAEMRFLKSFVSKSCVDVEGAFIG